MKSKYSSWYLLVISQKVQGSIFLVSARQSLSCSQVLVAAMIFLSWSSNYYLLIVSKKSSKKAHHLCEKFSVQAYSRFDILVLLLTFESHFPVFKLLLYPLSYWLWALLCDLFLSKEYQKTWFRRLIMTRTNAECSMSYSIGIFLWAMQLSWKKFYYLKWTPRCEEAYLATYRGHLKVKWED